VKTIFFDLDGVLADFVGGSLALHGKSIPPTDVQWDFMAQVGFSGGGDPAFWGPLSNPDFWAGLPILEDGRTLLIAAEALVGAENIGILSSGLCPGSCDGKRAWLDRHFPGYGKRAIFCTTKELVAAPGFVLVDDFDRNCEKFAAHGGKSVLVPRTWNARKGETDSAGRFNPEKLVLELLP
jgi:5'(3')-deoxyribonucleotidase